MSYTSFLCAQNFRTVTVILVLTVVIDTNGFPTRSESSNIRQDEDYLFDFMYDWIDRMSTELFPSLPTPPGSFVNEKNDLLSPLNTFDTKTHGKDSRRIYGQLRGYPGHSDFQISPVKRFGISKKHKVCTDVKLAPWARRLCSSLKRSA